MWNNCMYCIVCMYLFVFLFVCFNFVAVVVKDQLSAPPAGGSSVTTETSCTVKVHQMGLWLTSMTSWLRCNFLYRLQLVFSVFFINWHISLCCDRMLLRQSVWHAVNELSESCCFMSGGSLRGVQGERKKVDHSLYCILSNSQALSDHFYPHRSKNIDKDKDLNSNVD